MANQMQLCLVIFIIILAYFLYILQKTESFYNNQPCNGKCTVDKCKQSGATGDSYCFKFCEGNTSNKWSC
jgi:hypothetical protein